MAVPLTITGFSTALFSTWYFIEELGIVFDAGDGLSAGLLQKSRKVKHVFISHADRDHITGLLQFHQLNAQEGFPKIYYPVHSGSFQALRSFSEKFDPQAGTTEWIGLNHADEIQLKPNLMVQALRNAHVPVAETVIKSLGFKVYHTRTKLKSDYTNLGQNELLHLIKERGREALHELVKTNVIAYSGDTPQEPNDLEKWSDVKLLIHEATFFKRDAVLIQHAHINKHSLLEDVIEMASQLKNLEQLVLGHFSKRYEPEEIDLQIKTCCKHYGIKIPVYRVLPGQLHRKLLSEDPIYN